MSEGSTDAVRSSLLGLISLVICSCVPATPEPAGAPAELTEEIERYEAAKRAVLANMVESGLPRGERERADARRLAEGMVTLSGRILAADPEVPEFVSMEDGRTRSGLANPDNDHLLARVRGDRVYRIRGARGSIADLTLQTFRIFAGSSQGVDDVALAQLDVAADGSFEVTVSPVRAPGNWLRSDAQTHWVLIRRTYDDWNARAGAFSIERIDAKSRAATPLSRAEKLRQASENLEVSSRFWPGLTRSVLEQSTPNRVMPPRRGVGNLADQWTSMSLFSLSDDEALVVTVSSSSAAYQGLQVGSVFFDYFDPYRQVSLSRAQSHPSSDGLLRYVVSARDPGVPNWIDTTGHERGFLLLRWQGLRKLDPADFPTGKVIPLESLFAVLPPDVPRIDAAARRVHLDARAAQLDRRRKGARE